MAKIKDWKQNPSLRKTIEESLSASPVLTGKFWRFYKSNIQGLAALIIQWSAKEHKGALKGKSIAELTDFIEEELKRDVFKEIKQIFLLMQSSGADLVAPFESFAEINRLLEKLSYLRFHYHININGVIESPTGTYGGASLLMASVCDNIWSESSSNLHLTGR